MNGYARLGTLKRDIAGVSGTTDVDQSLATLTEEISREFDGETGRHFYSVTDTRVYSGEGSARLYLGDDLLAVTTLKLDLDGDGVYETTLTANTDYWLWPDNAGETKPYRAVEMNQNGSYATFPVGRRNVQVVGVFGYCSETDAVVISGTQVTGTLSSDTDLTLTASVAVESAVFVGDTLVIEDEQVAVTNVSAATVTVTRGVNGTTAVSHTDKSLYVRRYPRDVEEAVQERVVGIRWDTQGGYASAATLIGDASGAAGATQIRASYARWRRAVGRYLNPAGVI